MNEFDPTSAPHRPLLDEQLRLLRDRKAAVAGLLELGGEHDEVLVDALANDLIGAPTALIETTELPSLWRC